MGFIVFVEDEEIVCENQSDVVFALIGLCSPITEIPHHIEQMFERSDVSQ